ncbi:hypothetical protein Ahy_A04g018979 isoform A [Arachis hypogaea]|uniref:Transposase MuDR plant domain-containing protein n=1 Tax=Arachis hypogaea TaxID=3818 RepID=A0A445DF08_ARAHY|nr:hypothetical protein Ahy_A04g018979 isoform A [Arachis hypogaea]
MEFSYRKIVIMAIKDYTICRGVDYWVIDVILFQMYQYALGCNWLIRVSMIRKKYCWIIRRYNGSHTCTRSTIFQDHSKLDSNTITVAIKPLVDIGPSIKVKSVITELLQSMVSKEKVNEKNFRRLESIVRSFAIWFETMCYKESSAVVHFKTMLAYQDDDLVIDIRILYRVFWSYYSWIKAFRYCKLIV